MSIAAVFLESLDVLQWVPLRKIPPPHPWLFRFKKVFTPPPLHFCCTVICSRRISPTRDDTQPLQGGWGGDTIKTPCLTGKETPYVDTENKIISSVSLFFHSGRTRIIGLSFTVIQKTESNFLIQRFTGEKLSGIRQGNKGWGNSLISTKYSSTGLSELKNKQNWWCCLTE